MAEFCFLMGLILLQSLFRIFLFLVAGEKIDIEKFNKISWTIVEKERKSTDSKILTDDELFSLWQAFNKLVNEGTISIDIEEAALLIQEFMHAIGTPWTKGPLDDFTDKLSLTFWELVSCLETKYILTTPKRYIHQKLQQLVTVIT